MRPGAHWTPASTVFRVWAPAARAVTLHLVDDGSLMPMSPAEQGWFTAGVGELSPGARYAFRLDDGPDRPDPASLAQPEGVHGPSAVVDLAFPWSDSDWRGRPLTEQVIYELHVGTFTAGGTLDSAIAMLSHLVEMGVTTVELMPVAQFPGRWNWGYDGVDLYAVQDSYGGAAALQRFVDACHRAGLGVLLDVVYNHLGPDGNHLRAYGPYFTDRYRTPWGEAVNLDGPGSDHVRHFLVENALMWVTDFHLDGLRLDAVHALYDQTAIPFLDELTAALHRRGAELGRPVHVIAENAHNDPRPLRPRQADGVNQLDAAWNDDFHHTVHVALTGETAGYYEDFADPVPDLATALADGYVLAGRYSPHRGRRHGAPASDLPRDRLVVFAQNHDQIGNRAQGERLSTLVEPAALRLAAAVVLLSPWVPMLFMGEEWGETRPFLYFVDHTDPELVEAVRRGRAAEFAGMIAGDDPEVPDPAADSTHARSLLDWEAREDPVHAGVLELHRELIGARRRHPSLRSPRPEDHTVTRDGSVVAVRGRAGSEATLVVLNLAGTPVSATLPEGGWRRVLDGDERRFGGHTDRPATTGPEAAGSPSIETGAIEVGGWGFTLFTEGHDHRTVEEA